MKCYSLLLGARNTPSAGPRFTRRDDEQLRAITFRYFPEGFTILNAQGGWFDPERETFIEEESRQILVCAGSARRLRSWCGELALALDQSELLVIEHGGVTTFKFRPKPRVSRKIARRSDRHP
jgi:hypothetical protein